MEAEIPRFLIGASSSNSGKTTVTCAILTLLKRRGLRPMACKCGPDYIDPMFHSEVIGAKSRNLDLFLADERTVRALLAKNSAGCDITVIEGVMGYYDGMGTGETASAYDVARRTGTSSILIVDGRGRARSIAAEVLGFLNFREQSMIQGVILNRVSKGMYPMLKEIIEEETGISVFGYLPMVEGASLGSRHLGLVTAEEIGDLRSRLELLADAAEEGIDIDGLLSLASRAPSLSHEPLDLPPRVEGAPRIAVARDRAFNFYYEDCLQLLRDLGAELVPFSPIDDAVLPKGVSGLYLGGGYPELSAHELAENTTMLESIRSSLEKGMPTIAECGGFLYLHEELEDPQGVFHRLVGFFPGRAFHTPRLVRFGYVTLKANRGGLLCETGEELRAHEFHYWDVEDPGDAFHETKPGSARNWECAKVSSTYYAGFPHLYLYSNPRSARRFVDACARFARGGDRP